MIELIILFKGLLIKFNVIVHLYAHLNRRLNNSILASYQKQFSITNLCCWTKNDRDGFQYVLSLKNDDIFIVAYNVNM